MDTVIVRVMPGGADVGGEVFDAQAQWLPFEEAVRINPDLPKLTTVPEPTPHPDPAIQADIMARHRAAVADANPDLFPIQRRHGRTWREAGFYVVSGDGVLQRVILILDSDRKFMDRPGTTWSEWFGTLQDAQAAAEEIKDVEGDEPDPAQARGPGDRRAAPGGPGPGNREDPDHRRAADRGKARHRRDAAAAK